MERRWSKRTPVDLGVEVLSQAKESITCRTRDVGLGGVFLELRQTLVGKDPLVDLIFQLGEGQDARQHTLKAKVVRTADDGVGLMFRDLDAASFRSLQEILRFKKDAFLH